MLCFLGMINEKFVMQCLSLLSHLHSQYEQNYLVEKQQPKHRGEMD